MKNRTGQNLVIEVISIMAFGIGLQGCATMGAPFEFKGPNSIQIGKTTQADLTSQYGPPFRVGYEDGKNKWTYGYYQYRLFGSSDTKDLAVTFDTNGVVSSYTYSSSDPKEIELATKK